MAIKCDVFELDLTTTLWYCMNTLVGSYQWVYLYP